MAYYWLEIKSDFPECAVCKNALSKSDHVYIDYLNGRSLETWNCKKCNKKYVKYSGKKVVDSNPEINKQYITCILETRSNIKEISKHERTKKPEIRVWSQGDAYDKMKEKEIKWLAQMKELEKEYAAKQEEKRKEIKAEAEKLDYFFRTYHVPLELQRRLELSSEVFKLLTCWGILGEQNLLDANNDPQISDSLKKTIKNYLIECHERELKLKACTIQRYFSEHYKFGSSPFILDDRRAYAIAADGKRLLAVARAGSGKTRVLIAKVLWLINHEKVSPNDIIVLTFNRNVKNEIYKRLNSDITSKLPIIDTENYSISKTFHSLAYTFSGNANILKDKNKLVQEILEYKKKKDPTFTRRVYEYFRNESTEVDGVKYGSEGNFYDVRRKSHNLTLKGEVVRSAGEKWIADYLFEHRIDYQYEYTFFITDIKPSCLRCDAPEKRAIIQKLDENTERDEFGELRRKNLLPDFCLPKYNLVLEHWGINELEDTPEDRLRFTNNFDISWYEYQKNMQWKRWFWNYDWKHVLIPNGNKRLEYYAKLKGLVETSVKDMSDGRKSFEARLTEILSSYGVEIKEPDYVELIEEVWEKQITKFAELVTQFIDKYEQQFPEKDFADFINKIEAHNCGPRTKSFYQIAIEVAEIYFNTLSRKETPAELKGYSKYGCDFNQLIAQATHEINSGNEDDKIHNLKYLLIDEYQDFSQLFYSFVVSILNRNPSVQLFCVGDNWQAINRYMGADKKYYLEFEEYFDDAMKLYISTNYRSSKTIIERSNTFMKVNGYHDPPAKVFEKNLQRGAKSPEIEVIDINSVFVEMRKDSEKYEEDQKYGQILTPKPPKKLIGYMKVCIKKILSLRESESSVLILSRTNEFLNFYDLKDVEKAIKAFLEENFDYTAEEQKRIQICTIHSSKGLEADCVILLEVNEGNIPLMHPDTMLFSIFGENEITALEDEEALFYVAVTRAKTYLTIMYDRIDKQGNSKPSPFIRNLFQSSKREEESEIRKSMLTSTEFFHESEEEYDEFNINSSLEGLLD